MISVSVDNREFEAWAAELKSGQPFEQMLGRIADYTVQALRGEMSKFKAPTGKTESAMANRTTVKRSGNTFSVGVGDMQKIGVSPNTSAPPNTIRDFYDWYNDQVNRRG